MNTTLGIAIFVQVATGLIAVASVSKATASEPTLRERSARVAQSGAVLWIAQRVTHPQLVAQTVAQTETGCRQAHAATGVYTQPNLDSASRGVLNNGQTVRLDLTGSGTGWARITEPLIGWVEAKYLTPTAACTGLSPQASSAAPSTASSMPLTPTATVAAVCEVLPTEGLVVRSEPTTSGNTALHTIPKGTHRFQFTSDHLTSWSGTQERHWTYITAPYQGWISLGVVGGSFNLGGRECG